MAKYGLVGNNIKYSLSPKIYGLWFKKYQLIHTYDLLDIPILSFSEDFLKNLFYNEGYIALNFTKPFKERANDFCFKKSTEVNYIKSINTLCYNNNQLMAYNTDYKGLLDSFTHYQLNFHTKNILILGAGGACKALLYALKDKNTNIYIYNRSAERLKETVEIFQDMGIIIYNNSIHKNFHMIFNTTSADFQEVLNALSIKINDTTLYYDLNYHHSGDQLSKQNYIDGKAMLLYQASHNFHLYFGIKPKVTLGDKI